MRDDEGLWNAAYDAIEDAITSGKMYKYFSVFNKNTEYFTSSVGESFAQLFANVSAGKLKPDDLPPSIYSAIKKVWEKVVDFARQVIGASAGMNDPRLKTIEKLVDYAGGFIPKSERDDLLKSLGKSEKDIARLPDVNQMQSAPMTLKERMSLGNESAKTLAAGIGNWLKQLPEGIADPISKAIDSGLNFFMGIRGMREAVAALDYSVMGARTAGGQEQARLAMEAILIAKEKTRQAITPLVRSIEGSSYFDVNTIAKDIEGSIEEATRIANNRAMDFRAFVEDIDPIFYDNLDSMPDDIHEVATTIRGMFEEALRFEAEVAGLDISALRDEYASYAPRAARIPGKTYSRNPLSGIQWETEFLDRRDARSS